MTRSRTRLHAWIWLALIAFTGTRLSDIHLHLCFDGSEPPAAMHMADGAVHDDAHHRETRHVDQDVDVFDALLLAKKNDSAHDSVAIWRAPLVLLDVRVLISQVARSVLSLRIRPPLFHLRPPLRGPPR